MLSGMGVSKVIQRMGEAMQGNVAELIN